MHPDDARYAHLIGKRVVLPLVERAIPVIADEAVESAFGTGAVKVTPAHDQTDYEIGQRHGLPMPTVIDFDGRIAAPIWRYDETAEKRAPIDAQARAHGRPTSASTGSRRASGSSPTCAPPARSCARSRTAPSCRCRRARTR